MRRGKLILAFWGLLLIPSFADLPAMSDKPWLGYFLGLSERKYRFGITSKGKGVFTSRNEKEIFIDFHVVETLSTGKTIKKTIKDESLTSDQAATDDPVSTMKYRGKVTGDATFEVSITPRSNGFSLGGKILNQGKLKNPLRFEIIVRASLHRSEPEPRELRKQSISYVGVSRDKGKIPFKDHPFGYLDEDLISANIDTNFYDKAKISFEATNGSKLRVNDTSNPAWQSISFSWQAATEATAYPSELLILVK